MDPYVFVVGSPRSGTTLLQRMLDAHPRLAVANDTHFIPKAIAGITDHDVPLTHDLVERVLDYHRFHRLGVDADLARSLAVGADTYVGFISALYSAFATSRGKSMGGEKTPDYVRCIPLLAGLFSWARFVHIVRDGRDVALSALEWANEGKGPGRFELWATEPIAVCALWWRRQVQPGVDAGVALGPARYTEVLYESLVAQPGSELQAVSSFLSLDYSPRMESFNEGRQVDDGGVVLDAKKAWLPATPGLRDWRSSMSERDVALFEALAGDTLSLFGYERMFAKIPADIQETAHRCTAFWNAEKRIKRDRSKTAGSSPSPIR